MRITLKLTRTVLGLLFATIVPLAAQVPPAPTPRTLPARPVSEQELAAIRSFEERVADYATLHRRLEASLPPQRPTTNISELYITTRTLAARVRFARQDANTGDLFTGDIVPVVRRQIAACLSPEEWAAILAEHAVDEDGTRIVIPALRANMEWPPQVPFNFMPPQLLRVLPPLPPELQYRIIGTALVLWDHHANLIVDVLPAAFTT
jgi:hypothetical protein